MRFYHSPPPYDEWHPIHQGARLARGALTLVHLTEADMRAGCDTVSIVRDYRARTLMAPLLLHMPLAPTSLAAEIIYKRTGADACVPCIHPEVDTLRAALLGGQDWRSQVAIWFDFRYAQVSATARAALRGITIHDDHNRYLRQPICRRTANRWLREAQLPNRRQLRVLLKLIENIRLCQRVSEASIPLAISTAEHHFADAKSFTTTCGRYTGYPPNILRAYLGWELPLWTACRRLDTARMGVAAPAV